MFLLFSPAFDLAFVAWMLSKCMLSCVVSTRNVVARQLRQETKTKIGFSGHLRMLSIALIF